MTASHLQPFFPCPVELHINYPLDPLTAKKNPLGSGRFLGTVAYQGALLGVYFLPPGPG